MIGPDAERAHRAAADGGFVDAVTFAWGDPRAEVHGVARLGMAADGGSALAVVFADREPVAALARGGLALPDGADWEAAEIGGLRATVEAPLERWTLALHGDDAALELELEFEAASEPAAFGPSDAVARAGGMEGYEQLCRVTGTVTAGGRARRIGCAGQRGHAWGTPDWDRIALARTVTAWPESGPSVALTAIRPESAREHADEALWAVLLDHDAVAAVAEPRLSTTYDGEGRQRRAGMELWVGADDDYPLRVSGEVLCGSTLELGRLELACAFFRWHLNGHEGVGRYDVLRRADAGR